MRIVQRTTLLPLPVDAVWKQLLLGETFLYVARGILGVANAEAIRGPFHVGRTGALRLRAFHLVPVGKHEITVVSIDPVQHVIQTRERSWLLPVWNHTLTVAADGEETSRYTDRIEFDAGWLTPLAVPLVMAFFAYRQARWRRLARCMTVSPGQA